MATRKKSEPQYVKIESEESYGTFGRKGTSLKGAWFDLAEAYGGVQGLADAIGVSSMTIYRWGVKHEPIRLAHRNWIAALAAQKRLAPPDMVPFELDGAAPKRIAAKKAPRKAGKK